ncbi:MAG: hypothetical protein U9Q22_00685 [Candidatus Altiarchaeota archaeon]|nr:hypothetical protein [Candidatus Altiarchaeota archaeon]
MLMVITVDIKYNNRLLGPSLLLFNPADVLTREKTLISMLVFVRRGDSTQWLDKLKSICSRYSLNLVLKEYGGSDLNKFPDALEAISLGMKKKLYSLNAGGREIPQTLINQNKGLEEIKAGLKKEEFRGVYKIEVTFGKELDRLHQELSEREVREITDSLKNTIKEVEIHI